MAATPRGLGSPSFFSPIVAQRLRAMATASLKAGIAEMSSRRGFGASWESRQADRYFVSLLKGELERREAALNTHH